MMHLTDLHRVMPGDRIAHATRDDAAGYYVEPAPVKLTRAAQVTAWLQISLMGLCILGFLSLLALCVVQGGVK